jgi:hypothetical protein
LAPFAARSETEPSTDAGAIAAAVQGALARFDLDRPVRPVGVKNGLE